MRELFKEAAKSPAACDEASYDESDLSDWYLP